MTIQVLHWSLRDVRYMENWIFSNSQIVQICTSLAVDDIKKVEEFPRDL